MPNFSLKNLFLKAEYLAEAIFSDMVLRREILVFAIAFVLIKTPHSGLMLRV